MTIAGWFVNPGSAILNSGVLPTHRLVSIDLWLVFGREVKFLLPQLLLDQKQLLLSRGNPAWSTAQLGAI